MLLNAARPGALPVALLEMTESPDTSIRLTDPAFNWVLAGSEPLLETTQMWPTGAGVGDWPGIGRAIGRYVSLQLATTRARRIGMASLPNRDAMER